MSLFALVPGRRGSVVVAFALVFWLIAMVIGVQMDFAAHLRERHRLQLALDSAVLAGVSDQSSLFSQKVAVAQAVFATNVKGRPEDAPKPLFVPTDHRMTATLEATTETSFLKIFGIAKLDMQVASEAVFGSEAVEVALALDVTGSMRADMASLRQASRSLVSTVFTEATGPMKVAIVPFAANVNPGSGLTPATLDLAASSPTHGRIVESHWIAWSGRPIVPGPSVRCINPGAPQPSTGTPPNTDGSAAALPLAEPESWLAAIAPVGPAHAQTITLTMAPTFVPLSGVHLPSGRLHPTGFTYLVTCADQIERLANPSRVNVFDLFDRLPSVSWKGCVEARAEPYDVDDTAPSTRTPATLFYPFFYYDTASNQENDWIKDDYHNAPLGFTPRSRTPALYGGVNGDSLFKYNPDAALAVDETPPQTLGPNKGCPDPIVPLTDKQGTLNTAIAGLMPWDGGGTVISEGVAWARRVLSPQAPFTEGADGENVRKVIVLMSDGENEIMSATTAWNSQLTAYGGLRWGRLPTPWTFEAAAAFLDQRTALACTGAKAAGIEIYTVLFRSTSERARTTLASCASSPNHVFNSADGTALDKAFVDIARNITKLRLVR